MTALGVIALGALGALLRHAAGHWAARRGGWPRGTLAVNLVGSLLAGLVLGRAIEEGPQAAVVAGLCGGLTTFSTWSVEVVELAERPARLAAVGYAVGTAVGCVAMAWLGLALAG